MEDKPTDDKPLETNYGRHFAKTEDGDIVMVSGPQVRDFIPPQVNLGPHFQYDKNGNIVSKLRVKDEK